MASDFLLPLNHHKFPKRRQFVQQTFEIIKAGNLCEVAAAFTFGREDLLPDVFQRIVDELNTQAGGRLEDFKYYLERHIGLQTATSMVQWLLACFSLFVVMTMNFGKWLNNQRLTACLLDNGSGMESTRQSGEMRSLVHNQLATSFG